LSDIDEDDDKDDDNGAAAADDDDNDDDDEEEEDDSSSRKCESPPKKRVCFADAVDFEKPKPTVSGLCCTRSRYFCNMAAFMLFNDDVELCHKIWHLSLLISIITSMS